MKTVGGRKMNTILVGIILVVSTVHRGTDAQETSGPLINSTENEIILQRGQNFTLLCTGQRPVKFKQQSLTEDGFGASFQKIARNLTVPTDTTNLYTTAIDLIDVDQYAVGYYACFDDTVDSNVLLNDIREEPTNTNHVSYVYIYVNGTDSLFVPMAELVRPTRNRSNLVIGCRPTTPDVKITLQVVNPEFTDDLDYEHYDPKIGFIVDGTLFGETTDSNILVTCNSANSDNKTEQAYLVVQQRQGVTVPRPKVRADTRYFLEGETFTIDCNVQYQKNVPVELFWIYPSDDASEKALISTNEKEVETDGPHYYNVTIVNATKDDAGEYVCIAQIEADSQRRPFKMIYVDKPFIKLKKPPSVRLEPDGTIMATNPRLIRLQINVDAHPKPKTTFLRNGIVLTMAAPKYVSSVNGMGDVILTITNLTVRDSGNYTLVADNGAVNNNFTYDVRVKAAPEVNLKSNTIIRRDLNQIITLNCSVTGYPLPNVRWLFAANGSEMEEVPEIEHVVQSVYEVQSSIYLPIQKSGKIICKGENDDGANSASSELYVYEIRNGFGIKDTPLWYAENDNATLKCYASKYDYENVTWKNTDETVKYFESPFSHVAVLKIARIPQSKAGQYTCVGHRRNGEYDSQTISIQVEVNRHPVITEPTDENMEVSIYQNVQFSCEADGVPPPNIQWFKDGTEIKNGTDGLEIKDGTEIKNGTDGLEIKVISDHTVLNSTIIIASMKEELKGKYECVAKNSLSSESKIVNLTVPGKPNIATYLGICSVIFFALTLIVIYLTWKVKKEKRLRKELAKAGLLYFREGVPHSLNPELNLDEQAELLPYDEKFEFPAEKLFLGKQLGSGAFGVVYKAEARGILNAEETTTVAVKTVKKTADNMYIKALASELKIMVHLGKHVNIVNLLGACTKNIGKRELMVIVEYCRFGNIHNYLIKHREVFINQLATDTKEKGFGRVNRGYSCSSAGSGMHSDYGGSNHTQSTDHTFLNTANSTRKVSEGYVQPEWRTNYESDYQSAAPRPLFSRDLLAWAFQIARGMEYLASRKVLHGDLAARNIVLADDNIVKICDFGLARSICKNEEYQKKSDSLLPVKWLAIECLTDRIFSTQSDVWAFGIVLWELFSLAKTPYPSIPCPRDLLPFLSSGKRLEKPEYADDRLYDVMLRCWEHKPTLRPNFSELQEILGSFLEDNVRNHYVDLNSSYMDLNAKNAGQEDYLAMMNAPDYKNQVTPSPHHYQNGPNVVGQNFFPPSPTTIPQDQDGYLQMTPVNKSFSPMTHINKFDFDTRNTPSELSTYGSELTPMLTLNNLPARSGSESDHESGHSPYLNMCPRIEEEADDVFGQAKNAKNALNNGAVTNPTYITFGADSDKKSQNTYINMPNGLVK